MPRLSFTLLLPLLAGRARGDELLTLSSPVGIPRHLGAAVAIEGDLAVVGAPRDRTLGKGVGAVYVFDLKTGAVVHQLFASDATEQAQFGLSVDVDGGLVVVGASDPSSKRGSTYVFDLATGQELFRWKPVTPYGSLFGWDVAIDGRTVASVDLLKHVVYVFDLTTGQLRLLLRRPTWSPYSVALDGRDLLVGDGYRRAHRYDAVTGEELQTYVPPIQLAKGFGWDVALDGDVVLVGAPEDQGSQSGRAFAFDRESGVQLALLQPAEGLLGDRFGCSVDLRGGLAVVGASHDPIFSYGFGGSSGKGLGEVHVYDATTWTELLVVQPGHVTPQDLFGAAVATDGRRLLAGAPQEKTPLLPGNGLAYLFCISNDPVGKTYCSPANPNSFGLSGTIEARGCEPVVSAHLRLHAASLPPLRPAFFLASLAPGFVPNVGGSDGDLCLGGTIGRFGLQVADPAGALELALDLNGLPPPLPPAVLPGDTWHFQAWYRDGSTSNLTDAVAVTFR